jgi:hypothetical protein
MSCSSVSLAEDAAIAPCSKFRASGTESRSIKCSGDILVVSTAGGFPVLCAELMLVGFGFAEDCPKPTPGRALALLERIWLPRSFKAPCNKIAA